MASEPRYYIGVDLGQSRDPTAITVVRRVDPPRPVPEHDKPKPNYAPGSLEWEEEQWQSLPLTAQIRCTARGSQGVGGEVVRSTLTPLVLDLTSLFCYCHELDAIMRRGCFRRATILRLFF